MAEAQTQEEEQPNEYTSVFGDFTEDNGVQCVASHLSFLIDMQLACSAAGAAMAIPEAMQSAVANAARTDLVANQALAADQAVLSGAPVNGANFVQDISPAQQTAAPSAIDLPFSAPPKMA